MSPLRVLFFEEARENLDSMEQGLLMLESRRAGKEPIDAVFRWAHSIKGGAAAFGLSDVAELSHLMESLLDRLRSSQMAPDTSMVDLLLESVDGLRGMLARHETGIAQSTDGRGELARRLRAATQGREMAAATRLLEIRIGPTDRQESSDAVLQLFHDIPALGEASLLPAEREDVRVFTLRTSSADQDLLDLFALHVDPDQVSIRPVDTPTAKKIRPAARRPTGNADRFNAPAARDDNATIRVAVGKVDLLVSLAGELVDAQELLNRSSQTLDPVTQAPMLADLAALRRKVLRLQRAVLAIRTMPMALAFSRFPRMLRDLSAKLGKKFLLATRGETIELDRVWVEKMADPLTHLVRNSCDHGIETPHERRAAGKPEAGTITLSVSGTADAVVISVEDDGRGLVREKMVRAARARGMEVSDRMPDAQVWQLMFVPGLSTADAVTDVSGRGVGMDVVNRGVAALGGTVEVASVPGKGTRVSMRLPLPPGA